MIKHKVKKGENLTKIRNKYGLKEKPVSQIFPCPGSKIRSEGMGQGKGYGEGKGPIGRETKMGVLLLGQITRSLRTIRNLKGNVYVVGGLVTEGQTLRDIDIVIQNPSDIPKIKKGLGKFAERAHFMIQKKEPPSPIFLKITGREPRSPELNKSKSPSRYEYASPESYLRAT